MAFDEDLRRLTGARVIGSCWVCPKPNQKGYGYLQYKGRQWRAHRLAFSLYWNVDLPDWLFVCHNCPGGDNKACCNPEHMLISDAEGHAADTKSKGQLPTGDRHYSRLTPEKLARGERHGSKTHPERVRKEDKHPLAKLTLEQVVEIRRLYSEGCSSPVLAGKYGVDRTQIWHIVTGKHWKTNEPVPGGQRHSNSKFTQGEVDEIRRRASAGETHVSLAREYGVARPTISNVVSGKVWKPSSQMGVGNPLVPERR